MWVHDNCIVGLCFVQLCDVNNWNASKVYVPETRKH